MRWDCSEGDTILLATRGEIVNPIDLNAFKRYKVNESNKSNACLVLVMGLK